MADPGDIWQRYDTKVVQIQSMEARLAAVERELGQVRDERDHWARICRDLGKKLSVARTLAERLRTAERLKGGRQETARFRRPTELSSRPSGSEFAGSLEPDGGAGGLKHEYDRAREILGLVLTALSKALDDDAAAELGRTLRHHAGGKLLHSITRGTLTLVPVDGRYLVDRQWLEQLDLPGLRRELDVAAQSGIYTMPEDSLTAMEAQLDLDVDVDLGDDEEDGLPPPPPLSTGSFATLPPLLPALPEDPEPAPTPRAADTVRTQVPLKQAIIPNLRIGRLFKTPGTT